MIRRTLCLTLAPAALTLITPQPARAETPESPRSAKALLRKSADAVKRLKTIGYDAHFEATGWLKQWVPTVTARVIVGKQSKWDIAEFYCQAKIVTGDNDKPTELTAGCDGNEYFVIDHKNKKAHKDIDPAVLGQSGRTLERVVLSDLASANPYEDALSAESVRATGIENIDGEPCYVVHVKGKENEPDTTYWIHRLDFIPRKVKRDINQPGRGPAATILTLSKIMPNPTWKKDPFHLHVPEGFTLSDDFLH